MASCIDLAAVSQVLLQLLLPSKEQIYFFCPTTVHLLHTHVSGKVQKVSIPAHARLSLRLDRLIIIVYSGIEPDI